MEKKLKRWSEEEILRLREIMTRYTKGTEGCKYAARELNRPYTGVYSKWMEIKPKTQRPSVDETRDILYKNISKNPGNLKKAFRKTAEETGRSVSTIHDGYYNKKGAYSRHNASTCFTMISKNRIAANSKNFDSSKSQKTTKQRIKQFVASILGIKKEDL